MTTLALRGLKKAYDGKQVLHGINLDVAQGILEEAGVQVMLANDGAEALAELRGARRGEALLGEVGEREAAARQHDEPDDGQELDLVEQPEELLSELERCYSELLRVGGVRRPQRYSA